MRDVHFASVAQSSLTCEQLFAAQLVALIATLGTLTSVASAARTISLGNMEDFAVEFDTFQLLELHRMATSILWLVTSLCRLFSQALQHSETSNFELQLLVNCKLELSVSWLQAANYLALDL